MIKKNTSFKIELGLVVLVMLLTACSSGGSYQVIMGSLETAENKITGSYNTFSGHYFKEISLQKGDKLNINLISDTDKGQLKAELVGPEGNIFLQFTGEKQAQHRKLTIPKEGIYKFKVIGDNHQGSFTLSWDVAAN